VSFMDDLQQTMDKFEVPQPEQEGSHDSYQDSGLDEVSLANHVAPTLPFACDLCYLHLRDCHTTKPGASLTSAIHHPPRRVLGSSPYPFTD
jgi:hypothetical protein